VTRVLVVDDEPQILRALRTSLEARDYKVIVADHGEDAVGVAATTDIDLVILDLGLPDMEGVEVAKRIRAFSEVPIIVLTVREELSSKVAALDAGVDDYVTKPFAMEELLARMRAALRRAGQEQTQPILNYGDIEVDLARHLVTRTGRAVHLTPTEYRLLEVMATNPGKLLTHRWLLSKVWGVGYGEESQYLRVFVGQLRKKLEDDPSNPRWVLTEPGVGYRWSPEDRGDEPQASQGIPTPRTR
jgi:two-component system KDP operon response regulator KdpE